MDIVFKEEKLADCLEELKPLLKLHWEELANNKDIKALDPDYATYLCLNEINVVRVFTVRIDTKLVGYSIWIVNKHLHYKTWVYAVADVYWLHPDQRKTGVSYDFFFKTEDWLKSLGVKAIVVQDKLNHSHTSFFNRLGYTPIEQNYEKMI
jgi:hypothetical protein